MLGTFLNKTLGLSDYLIAIPAIKVGKDEKMVPVSHSSDEWPNSVCFIHALFKDEHPKLKFVLYPAAL